MTVQNTKSSLAMTYKMLNDEGLLQSKSLVVNDVNVELSDADLYDISLLIKNILAYGVEKTLRRSEVQYLEDWGGMTNGKE